MMPNKRFQTMLLMNIALSRRSHSVRLKPTVVVKNIGIKTKNPNCGAVLMMRTTQPMAVFGLTPTNTDAGEQGRNRIFSRRS